MSFQFQDMIGRSDMLKAGESLNSQKGKMLNFEKVLLNALDMRPGVNIIGGSIKQDFELEQRLVREEKKLQETFLEV